ncbi:MAG: 2-oxo acid dehydrogenase subunit E2 [Chloroflexi bacterium]|nr:2-oxo acid dehydrogenase subunit E2 [Chloroflexota bacterium]
MSLMPEVELKLPLLGDVMTEGTLAEWLAPDGAAVRKGDALYQLETDKVNYTVDAPADGTLRRLVPAGETVPVGTLVGTLSAVASAATELASSPSLAAAPSIFRPASDASPSPAAAGEGRVRVPAAVTAEPADLRITPAARRLARELDVDLAALPTDKRLREADIQAFHEARRPSRPAHGSADLRATPAARKLARQLGLDLDSLHAGGLIRESDVLSKQPSRLASMRLAEPRPSGAELTGRRKVIADRMHRSVQDIAQLTISLEVDMTAALSLREQLKQLWPEDAQPTITDLVARASILALPAHPNLNATLDANRLTLHGRVNLGLAVDADEGLIVPVIHDASELTLKELAFQTKATAARARANQLTPEDVHGGTFTITTLGALGIDFFTPIVNPPQVAILGIGRVFPKLALDNGQVVERQAMYLNLSFDHRAVDGAPAARYLNEVKRFLELPAALIV